MYGKYRRSCYDATRFEHGLQSDAGGRGDTTVATITREPLTAPCPTTVKRAHVARLARSDVPLTQTDLRRRGITILQKISEWARAFATLKIATTSLGGLVHRLDISLHGISISGVHTLLFGKGLDRAQKIPFEG